MREINRSFEWKTVMGSTVKVEGVHNVEFTSNHVVFYGEAGTIIRGELAVNCQGLKETTNE